MLVTSYFRAEAKITEEHIFNILQIECNIFKYDEEFNEKGKWKSDEIKRRILQWEIWLFSLFHLAMPLQF